MIPVLVTAVRNRRELRGMQPQRRTIPAREILDRWEPEARTPVPGSRKSSAGANTRAAGNGFSNAAAPADPETRSLAAADTHTGDEGDSKR